MSAIPNKLHTYLTGVFAAVVFVPLFATGGIDSFDFWWWLSANSATLVTLAAFTDSGWRNAVTEDLKNGLAFKVGLAFCSAAFLYLVFYVGNELSRTVLAFAGKEIDAVYEFKTGASTLRIGLLIGLVIGPAEELFWRAFLQRRLGMHYGEKQGFFIATAVYAGVHVASQNPMLVVAALVCGAGWGYLWLRYRSITLNVLSHVVWTLSVFVFFPLS